MRICDKLCVTPPYRNLHLVGALNLFVFLITRSGCRFTHRSFFNMPSKTPLPPKENAFFKRILVRNWSRHKRFSRAASLDTWLILDFFGLFSWLHTQTYTHSDCDCDNHTKPNVANLQYKDICSLLRSRSMLDSILISKWNDIKCAWMLLLQFDLWFLFSVNQFYNFWNF